MKTCYRIVTDRFLGYEVQVRYWWWPFWSQVGFTNTFMTIKDAQDWIIKGCPKRRHFEPKEVWRECK